METLDLISSAWPIAVSFVTIVIVLAKLHANQETMAEKIKVLFELWNKRDK